MIIDNKSGYTHKLPSPTKRIVRPRPRSCAAYAAPKVLPTVQPMLPHKIWLTNVAPAGKGISRIPKLDVPEQILISPRVF